MKLSTLLKQIISIPADLDLDIAGLAIDSRLVKPGDLFFACQGSQLDGNLFIDDAVQKGALAVLTEKESKSHRIPTFYIPELSKKIGEIAARFFEFPSQKMHVIGITGTNGKTSCSHFLAGALQEFAIPCGVVGTLGNGMYGHIKSSALTTPDAITLQKTFSEFLTLGARAIAMEVSSHSLEQGRVNAIHFDIGIFTNLSRDHLDYHGSMENYAAAKRKLFEKTDLQYAVINADDEFGKNMIESRVHDRIFAYSVDKKLSLKNSVPTIFAEEVQLDLTGIYARISTPWGEGNLQVPLIGKFNLSNCLAVLTSLCLLEIPMATALSVFSRLHSVEGRMQVLGGQHQPLVIVDYAHTPDALEKVLSALRAHCKGKLFCLFGCGGDRDRGKRPLMAKVAERLADEIFVTNDNPRTENAEQIAAEIMQGFAQPNKVKIELDRAKAIQEIIRSASSDDCVLIAGKGAETYQIIGKEKIPFSDVEVVRNCLS